jgi:predicted nucleic acid-binding protein
MAAPGILYLDSSAIVKFVASEQESVALHEFLSSGGPAVASALAKVEVHRAVNRLEASPDLQQRMTDVMSRIALIKVDDAILQRAAQLGPTSLRSLDAIHLATALSVRQHLEAFVVYDRKLAEAAEQLGLAVAAPK